MDSDLRSLIALGVSVLALVFGEWRAWRARGAASERNIIDWEISWPTRDGFVLHSRGPDVAKRVLIKFTAEGVTREATAKRMKRGDSLLIPMPELASRHDEVDWETQLPPSESYIANIVGLSARVTWASPKGKPAVEHFDTHIQARIPNPPLFVWPGGGAGSPV